MMRIRIVFVNHLNLHYKNQILVDIIAFTHNIALNLRLAQYYGYYSCSLF